MDPRDVQAGFFVSSAGARRFCFNHAIAAIHTNHAEFAAQREAGVPKSEWVKPPSTIDLRAAWKLTRPVWSKQVSSWVFDHSTREAATAHKNFLTGRARFPRFAKRGKTRDRYTEIVRHCHPEPGVLHLPKIGSVRICAADPAQTRWRRLIRRGRARIMTVMIGWHTNGTWWATGKNGAHRDPGTQHRTWSWTRCWVRPPERRCTAGGGSPGHQNRRYLGYQLRHSARGARLG